MTHETALPPIRTVCHGCRGVSTVTEQMPDGGYRSRMLLVPGDGTVTRVVSVGDGSETAVTEDCSVCQGEGWLPGFVPPV